MKNEFHISLTLHSDNSLEDAQVFLDELLEAANTNNGNDWLMPGEKLEGRHDIIWVNDPESDRDLKRLEEDHGKWLDLKVRNGGLIHLGTSVHGAGLSDWTFKEGETVQVVRNLYPREDNRIWITGPARSSRGDLVKKARALVERKDLLEAIAEIAEKIRRVERSESE